MDFRSVSLTRSYQQVVEQILDAVRRGSLTPGQRLPTERELSESFGVSRAVVREALKVLAAMGLVESRQGSGNFISANPVPSISRALILSATPEEESLLALFELREPLEAFASQLAAVRRTPEQAKIFVDAAELSYRSALAADYEGFAQGDSTLHVGIIQTANNPYLMSVATAVREVLGHTLRLLVTLTGSMVTAAEQHVAIAAAIERSDPEAAASAAAEHVRYNVGALREMIDSGVVVPITHTTIRNVS